MGVLATRGGGLHVALLVPMLAGASLLAMSLLLRGHNGARELASL